MNLLTRFNLLLHACVVLGTAAFCTADDKPLLGLLALAATLACFWMSRGARAEHPPMLPRLIINLLVFAAIVNAAVRAFGNTLNEEFVSTLGQFLVFIVLIKLLDRRGPRDDAQLITLTIFIAVASVLTNGSLPVGVLLMAYIPTVVATAMTWQLRAGQVMLAADAKEAAALTGANFEVLPTIATGRKPRRGFIGVLMTAVLASCAAATIVFVVLPRGIGSDLFGRFGMQPQATMGFREAVRLGESGFLSENPSPVMDVQVTTPSGETIGGTGETLYLRGASRDIYNPENRVWDDPSAARTDEGGTSSTERVQEGREYTINLRGAIPKRAGTTTPIIATRVQKITMRAEAAGGTMFCLWRPMSMTPDRTADVHFSRRNGTMRHTTGVGQRFSYTVTSVISDETSSPPHSPSGFRTGRIHDLAGDVLKQKGIGDDAASTASRQAIATIRDYLRTNYTYTLEMVPPPEREDPIEFFLFDRKKGHCEYFASAMAAMCQSQRIPCRVITGYVATEFNSLTGAYLVRESNAHAWVEAFITTDPEKGNGRWETFDASPPGDIERIHRPPAGLMAGLRSWYDALEFGWSSTVIGYDNTGSQRSRLARFDESRFSSQFVATSDRLVSWLKTMRTDPKLIPIWIRIGPAAVLIGVAIWFIVKPKLLWRVLPRVRVDPRPSFGMTPYRPTGFYARALKALSKAGIAKPDQLPPSLHAAAVAAYSPEAAGHLRAIATMIYRTRFGGQALTAQEQASAEEHVRLLEASLRTAKAASGKPASKTRKTV